jgi:hypothetical protein
MGELDGSCTTFGENKMSVTLKYEGNSVSERSRLGDGEILIALK